MMTGMSADVSRSEAPLLHDLGLVADWKLVTDDGAYFSVTRAIHNGLQGAIRALTTAGFDLGSGIPINPSRPEEAATTLRRSIDEEVAA